MAAITIVHRMTSLHSRHARYYHIHAWDAPQRQAHIKLSCIVDY